MMGQTAGQRQDRDGQRNISNRRIKTDKKDRRTDKESDRARTERGGKKNQ